MFDQAVQTSEAMQEAARSGRRRLFPALSGCTACETTRMIASPVLGRCVDCGAEFDVLQSTEPTAPNS
jgi:hypothetical protein